MHQQEGMTPNCTVTIDVDENGDPPCTLILEQWDLTIEQFFAWNPSVGADCSGMWAGKFPACSEAKRPGKPCS